MEKLTITSENLKALIASADSSSSTPTIKSDRFAALWAKLCAAYPRQESTIATAEVFYEQLSPYTEEQLTDAIGGIITKSKWFPAVAEIIEEIKGEYQCPHKFEKAEIRIQREQIKSLQLMLTEHEKHHEKRMQGLIEQIAELEAKRKELYERDCKMIEESGLPQAQAKLDAVNAKILEQERILTILKQKVKLFDQARLIQADQ